jgi:hypothetical protein
MLISHVQRLLIWSALISLLVLLETATGGSAELLAFAGPVLVLALPLFMGRYLGEEQLVRAARRSRERSGRLSPLAPAAWLRRARHMARGGRLLGESLAVRPPPVPVR